MVVWFARLVLCVVFDGEGVGAGIKAAWMPARGEILIYSHLQKTT